MPRAAILRQADTDRIRALLVDCPNGVRAPDIARNLGIGAQRVKDHLAAGRKTGLFILCCAGGPMWYSLAHEGVVREKLATALKVEMDRRRARSRTWHEARRVKVDVEDVELLPVRRVIGRGWVKPPAAPGPTSVFTLGGCSLSNC